MNFEFNCGKENKSNFDELNIGKNPISSLSEEKEIHFNIKNDKLKYTQKVVLKILYLEIFDINKDEDFWEIYMFYGKRLVKSKKRQKYIL